jgi:hypothetical protein
MNVGHMAEWLSRDGVLDWGWMVDPRALNYNKVAGRQRLYTVSHWAVRLYAV